jgi:hypothetical protein
LKNKKRDLQTENKELKDENKSLKLKKMYFDINIEMRERYGNIYGWEHRCQISQFKPLTCLEGDPCNEITCICVDEKLAFSPISLKYLTTVTVRVKIFQIILHEIHCVAIYLHLFSTFLLSLCTHCHTW